LYLLSPGSGSVLPVDRGNDQEIQEDEIKNPGDTVLRVILVYSDLLGY
jgi:hypothetical protein